MKKYLITFLICNLTLMSSWVYAVEFKIRGMMGQTENVQEKQIYSEESSWSFFIDYFGVSHDSYIVRGFKNNLNDFDSKIISNQILFSIGNPINITLGKSIQTNGEAFSKVNFNSENVRSIIPSHGLNTKYYEEILGKSARNDISYGTPLTWNLIN